jgi:hypothetical protein
MTKRSGNERFHDRFVMDYPGVPVDDHPARRRRTLDRMTFALARGPLVVRALMGLVAVPERSRRVDLDDDVLEVRLGWSFHLRVPRETVVAALRDRGRITGIGAHGWRGTWLVNTSAHGLVRLELDPPGRASVCGVPVRVRMLRVSLADPDAFLALLRAGSSA